MSRANRQEKAQREYMGPPYSDDVFVWNIGKYLRLSDKDEMEDVSRSIVNQSTYLDERIERLIKESGPKHRYTVVKTYSDDGKSGTNILQREAFQSMLSDIEEGIVNCVIVKDLNRMFRNHADQGEILERLFRTLNVRFICCSLPEIDTFIDPYRSDDIDVQMHGVINQNFSRTISHKVREMQGSLMRQGKNIAAFAKYGYIKDPEDKHKRLIDEEPNRIIRMFGSWIMQGKSLRWASFQLNAMGIASPTDYKRLNGSKYKNPHTDKFERTYWTPRTIKNILTDEFYLGHTIQGKTRKVHYTSKERVKVPKKDWIVVKNTHDPTWSQEEFDLIQKILLLDSREGNTEEDTAEDILDTAEDILDTAEDSIIDDTKDNKNGEKPKKPKERHMFSGLLVCSDCKRSHTRHVAKGKSVSYMCSTYKKNSKDKENGCTKHSIPHELLATVVLDALQKQIALAVDFDAVITEINQYKSTSDTFESKIKKSKLEDVTARISQVKRYRKALAEKLIDGKISEEQFDDMQIEYDMEIKELKYQAEHLQTELEKHQKGITTENPFIKNFKQYSNLTKLSREVLLLLIDHITIYEGKRVTIKFSFEDEITHIDEYIYQNRHLLENAI